MIDIQSKNGNSKLFLLTLLGMLTAFGPFVTDMYLPSLPLMGEYFRTTPSLVQLGLTASMIGLAAGQIFFGPLSDKYGRRPPLLAAMYLFIISTIGCIFAPTIEMFVMLRLLQGVAGAGGIVISRSVATDMFTGKELAKTLGDNRGYQRSRSRSRPDHRRGLDGRDRLERYLLGAAGIRNHPVTGKPAIPGIATKRTTQGNQVAQRVCQFRSGIAKPALYGIRPSIRICTGRVVHLYCLFSFHCAGALRVFRFRIQYLFRGQCGCDRVSRRLIR